MKASELIGSQVLSLSTATMCGTVCDIVPSPDLKRVKALGVFMNDDDDCEKKYLDVAKVAAVADDVVTVKYEEALVMCYPAEAASPVNTPAYSERGESYGNVTDLDIDEKFNIVALYAQDRAFAPADVLTRSGDLVVFRLPGSKTRIAKPKKKVPAPAVEKREPSSSVRITELRRYSFLLGKKLNSNVTDSVGETVATIGQAVTDEVIDRAKRRGAIARLVESTLSAR